MEDDGVGPAVHVMCGLVGAGKTTLARTLASSLPGVRFSRDEWMIRLYQLGYDEPEYAAHLESCTDLMWDVALDVLDNGVSVILDWNHWSRQHRSEAKQRAARSGHDLWVHHLDVSLADAMARLNKRNADRTPNTHRIDVEESHHFMTIFEPPEPSESIRIVTHR